MVYRTWHELPNRHSRGTMHSLASLAALVISLNGSPVDGQAADKPIPSPDSSAASISTDESPLLHSATSEELKLWIAQLGSTEFSVRERAVRQLSRCDATAVQPLRKAAEESSDLEVKSRCLAIADAIYDLDIGKRTSDFLKDPDPLKTHGFEGWLAFSEIVGKNRLSKRLFAELIESHPEHAVSKQESSAELATSLQREASEIFNKFRTAQNIELGDTVSLLYRSIEIKGEVPKSVEQITVLLLRSAPLTIEISRPPMRMILQKLIGSWIKITKSDPSAVLMIAIDNDISEGIDIARQALANPNCEPSLFVAATSALMRFGNSEDLALLEPWRTEQKLIQKEIPVQVRSPMAIPNSDPNDGQPNLEFGPRLMIRPPVEMRMYELRYQDLALAASAQLMDREDIRDLFPRLQTHPTYVFRPDSVAFPQADDEARQRVIDALAKVPSRNDAKPLTDAP